MQAEAAVAGPVVHRLEGDQRELLVDGQLGDGAVLDAVRPAPEDLAIAQRGEVFGLRLGQQDDVGVGDEFFARTHASDEGSRWLSAKPNPLAVTRFEDDRLPQLRIDALEVSGVDRQPLFVRFCSICL